MKEETNMYDFVFRIWVEKTIRYKFELTIVILILIVKWLAIKGNKKLLIVKKNTINNDLMNRSQSHFFILIFSSKLLTNRGYSRWREYT